MDIKIYKLLSISLMYRSIYIQNNIVHAFDQNNIFIKNKNGRFIARLRKSEKPETHQNCPITSKYHLSLSILYYISDDVKRDTTLVISLQRWMREEISTTNILLTDIIYSIKASHLLHTLNT